MAEVNQQQVIDYIKGISVMELSQLVTVADRVLNELERRVLPEVADREDRLEHRLQALVLALGGQAVHLQEAFVTLPLDLDQVRNRNRRLDLREVLTLAVDVFRKAVHASLGVPEGEKTYGGHRRRTPGVRHH
ncbi:MAG: hypothetical protein A3J29_08220 [Acidobacteria bacterium RIFCSPLOWO2_12_FULL_67_14b]|nr:MAG: hypothetical protein A3J29_08220 [Acidobacteria bacterium RIFCSPLOWO2_12_FULL_67_14b]